MKTPAFFVQKVKNTKMYLKRFHKKFPEENLTKNMKTNKLVHGLTENYEKNSKNVQKRY